MQLNLQQEALEREVFHFLLSNDKEYIISGCAGTGKTFFLQYLHDTILQKYHNSCKLFDIVPQIKNIVFTATTNKAVEVLGKSLNNLNGVCTINKYLGLTIHTDYKTGKTNLHYKRNTSLRSNTLVIIDEASYIDYQLYKYIKDLLLNENCKVIYVGDKDQLLSPNCSGSPVFNNQSIKMFELTEIMRSKTNQNITELTQQLRINVKNSTLINPTTLFNKTTVIGNNQLEYIVNNDFPQNTDEIVFLGYTNKQINDFSNYYRKIHNLPSHFIEGETVINSNYTKIDQNTSFHAEQVLKIERVDVTPKIIYHDPLLGEDITGYNIDVSFLNGLKVKCIDIPNNYEDVTRLKKGYIALQQWKNYFLLDEIPLLKTSCANTIHKAQGSSFNKVIIDYNDLMKCKQLNTKTRLLYVACSRAREQIYIYDSNLD